MGEMLINLDWGVDSKGYRIMEPRKGEKRLVRQGGAIRASRPLKNNDIVFQIFSEIKTEDHLLRFVENYGFLNTIENPRQTTRLAVGRDQHMIPDPALPHVEGESVAEDLAAARLFREMLNQSANGLTRVSKTLRRELEAELEVRTLAETGLVFDAKRGLKMTFNANSLLDGMWLQLAQKLSGAQFRICEHCGTVFEVGSAGGRRADAKYCSNEHRITANSAKRSQGD